MVRGRVSGFSLRWVAARILPRTGPVRTVLTATALVAAMCGVLLSSPSASGQTPKSGGHLTIAAVGAGWVSLDPINPEDFPSWGLIGAPIYNSLFYVQNNGSASPQLATSYTWENNAKELVIQLRRNVQFQDGTPFNAAAVVFNLNRGDDAKLASECPPDFQTVTGVAAIGTYTVRISFSQTNSAMPAFLGSTPCGMMASPTAVKKWGANYGSHPVGTGPFELVSQTTNSVINLKRNPDYWQKGLPYLSTVTILAVSSASSALDSVQSGTAQIMVGLASAFPQQVLEARKDSSLKTLSLGEFLVQPVWFNNTVKPFNNVLARRAVAEATDPSSIIKTLMYGLAAPTESWVGPSSWAFPGATVPGYPSYNLSAAKALVKKLGGLSFSIAVEDNPTGEGSVQEADALVAQWAQAGIRATVNPLNVVSLVADAHSMNYQAMDLSTPGSIEPNTVLYRNNYCTSALNQTGYCNTQVDALLIKGQEQLTFKDRAATYKQVFGLLARGVPYAYLYSPQLYDIVSNKVNGFAPNGTEWLELENTWLG
jgi:peptide/nickel transport system substrate-binding protein